MGGRVGAVILFYFFFQFATNIGCCLLSLFISCVNISCLAGFSSKSSSFSSCYQKSSYNVTFLPTEGNLYGKSVKCL